MQLKPFIVFRRGIVFALCTLFMSPLVQAATDKPNILGGWELDGSVKTSLTWETSRAL